MEKKKKVAKKPVKKERKPRYATEEELKKMPVPRCK